MRLVMAIFVAIVCVVCADAHAQAFDDGDDSSDTNVPFAASHPAYFNTSRPTYTNPTQAQKRRAAVIEQMVIHAQAMTAQEAQNTAEVLCDESENLGYDPLLFLAVIDIESHFNALALSHVGAQGLMQLMPQTAEALAAREQLRWRKSRLFDPSNNVRLGVRYLVLLDQMFKHHIDRALTAYNRGPGATHRLLRQHHGLPIQVRAEYAGRVLSRYAALRAMYGRIKMP